MAISIYLKKRHGYGTFALAYVPHNTAYVVLGTVFLWFGWFGAWFCSVRYLIILIICLIGFIATKNQLSVAVEELALGLSAKTDGGTDTIASSPTKRKFNAYTVKKTTTPSTSTFVFLTFFPLTHVTVPCCSVAPHTVSSTSLTAPEALTISLPSTSAVAEKRDQ
jgi:hypothetical protein